MTRLLVAKNLQAPPRLATKQETCHHWMIPQPHSFGRMRGLKCSYCGKTGSRPMKPGESIIG